MIGATVVIKGDITGGEDILVQGRVEGTIRLDDHNLVVGPNGDISADVTAREIEIDGNIEGDITGHEKIIVRSSGRVKGNMKAPKVVLEEGSQFRGSVEMDVDAKATQTASSSVSSAKVSSIGDSAS